ncbi:hypothetical protein PRK78_005969 [Emydomyces testavorans]|uniref:BTB domain-containing protein n=1 Tax=Emydomyces testavorans TaxID=2070801 RepID=A0AAF0DKU3_9EURO|nr:hypothetical protein PRK78_005969 [Emydomyces testavorans]
MADLAVTFLETGTFLVRCAGSDTYTVHQAIIRSKGGHIFSAIEKKYAEEKHIYTFQDTDEGTLLRFIVWAYYDDYPAVVEIPTSSNDGEQPSKDQPIDENHAIFSHLRVYIFADAYMIPCLKWMAGKKLTDVLDDMNAPEKISERLDLILALDLAVSHLPESDLLLHWLTWHCACWLEKLRSEPQFFEILGKIASCLIKYVQASESRPPDWVRMDQEKGDIVREGPFKTFIHGTLYYKRLRQHLSTAPVLPAHQL